MNLGLTVFNHLKAITTTNLATQQEFICLVLHKKKRLHKRAEVVFCANDAMALGVLDAARFALMLRVPSDVSVLGFDDIPSGRRPAYLLTTVRQPTQDMASVAASLLRASVDEQVISTRQLLLPGTLIERGSAQMLPGASSSEQIR